MHLTKRLKTLKVSRIDGESILITGLGLLQLVPGLVDGPLQVKDQVGQGEDLQCTSNYENNNDVSKVSKMISKQDTVV